ncbi:Carboxymuconolactone decarboxylase family protein [Polystyrenella longa]|uniref:Carboxymuconolactone decarboxylase family protein n=1 Tax=Polystyrenella longa TaxID=2528007 RepID=A0A518CM48_9PLAN|nr:carboxymuconolactone decarboxylase family protein [Polystyrenella longa]QDU80254.1 Carboxymuconolactone decarboxylase family protein [Polystyrenella longa]
MVDFQIHTIESGGESASVLEKSKQAYGYVPNLHAVMAESPELLEAYRTVAEIFGKTNLSETERQIIAMTNNRLNGCEYCMAAHTSIMQGAKVPEDVIMALRDGTSIADPKLEALRVYAEKVNLSRGWPEESDVEAFLEAGYTKQTVLEVILGTAYKVLSNYTNHVAQTPVDKPFAKNAWSTDEQPVR